MSALISRHYLTRIQGTDLNVPSIISLEKTKPGSTRPKQQQRGYLKKKFFFSIYPVSMETRKYPAETITSQKKELSITVHTAPSMEASLTSRPGYLRADSGIPIIPLYSSHVPSCRFLQARVFISLYLYGFFENSRKRVLGSN